MEIPDYIIIALLMPLILLVIGLMVGIFWDYIKAGFEFGRKIIDWRKRDE